MTTFGSTTRVEHRWRQVESSAEEASFKNTRHAGFSLAKKAKKSIKTRKGPSEPGEVPHTRGQGGHNLRGAIFVDGNRWSTIVGPRESFVGEAGESLEFGKERSGDDSDAEERPFMLPALLASLDRFPLGFSGTIGE